MNKVNPTLIKLVFLLAFSFLCISVNAQKKTKPATKAINSGVVNGKAISLPKPLYPPAIDNKKRTTGTVNVQVLIDEQGNVISAKAIKGVEDVSLRQAAEVAALQAKFQPTTLLGKPVKVNGVIVYNFVDTDSNEKKLQILGLSTFLYMVRNFANDLELLKKATDSKDIVKETAEEFSEFSDEINKLNSLENLSYDERIIKIDEVVTLIKTNLSTAEKWQFELGKNLGGIISQFMEMNNTETFDPGNFDEARLKKSLLEIKELSLTAPSDFPPDVLQELKNLAAESEKERIFTPENVKVFIGKMDKLLSSISPDSVQ